MNNPEKLVPELTPGLHEVAGIAARRPHEREQLIERALAALGDSIPYEIAAYFEVEASALRVRAARGPLVNQAVLECAVGLERYPTLRSVLEAGQATVLEGGEQPEDDHPFAELVPLPDDHPLMVVPVIAGDQRMGILTFTGGTRAVYGPEMVRLAAVYAALIGLGSALADRAERLEELHERLREENRLLEEEVSADTDASRALERLQSREMRRLVRMAKQVAITDAPVLITGETGTGKEVFARGIHGWSNRAERTFIKINCAALPETLIESELFGHRRGAFSGAVRDRPGRFRLADEGTLFLDEVGDLPPTTQVKLLRVLEEGAFEPVGSDRTERVDVRVLAATNVDLERAIDDSRFREDLYYRLHVFPLCIPPLRERPDDLAPLVEHILERIHRRTGRGPWRVPEASMQALRQHHWPGNVRELVNTLERARVLRPAGGELTLALDSGTTQRSARKASGRHWPTLREYERDYIERVLRQTNGKIYGENGAAKILGLPPTTLQSKMDRLGVQRPT